MQFQGVTSTQVRAIESFKKKLQNCETLEVILDHSDV